MDDKIIMAIDALKQNIITKFGTNGFEALESFVKDPVFTSEWQKMTVAEIRQWAHDELEPFWLSALLTEPERLV